MSRNIGRNKRTEGSAPIMTGAQSEPPAKRARLGSREVFQLNRQMSAVLNDYSLHDGQKFEFARNIFMSIPEGCRNVDSFHSMMNVELITKTPGFSQRMDWLFNQMKVEGVQPDAVTFRMLNEAAGEYRSGETKEGLLQNVHPPKTRHLERRKVCDLNQQMSRVLRDSKLTSSQKLDKATTIFMDIPEGSRDVYSFSTMMNVELKTRTFDFYQRLGWLFNQMKAEGVEPNVVTYNTLIKAAGENQDYNYAKELFGEMDRKRLQPDVVTYSTLIKAAAENRDYPHAKALFREMGRNGLQPDVVTYKTLIKAEGENEE